MCFDLLPSTELAAVLTKWTCLGESRRANTSDILRGSKSRDGGQDLAVLHLYLLMSALRLHKLRPQAGQLLGILAVLVAFSCGLSTCQKQFAMRLVVNPDLPTFFLDRSS